MKKNILFFSLLFFLLCACSKNEAPQEKTIGYLTLNISPGTTMKGNVDIADFNLRINNGFADVLKEPVCNLPEQIELPVGKYTIEVYSMLFSEPKFDLPLYSGITTVEIEANQTKNASIVCSQSNAGIKAVWSKDFSDLYGTFQAQMYCNEGFLNYSSNETRTGYFLPGTITVTILADGQTINGGTVTLAARDMVTLNLQPKESSTGNLSIEISFDETLNNRELELIVDSENISNSETSPYTIAQSIVRQGENSVWVTGYIVGAKPQASHDFINGTWLSTNIVIADDIDETNDRNVIFVELPSGTYRNNLNLVDNSHLLHQKVLFKGNLSQYQSRAGLRNLTSYSFP